jgi:hypothetical protein
MRFLSVALLLAGTASAATTKECFETQMEKYAMFAPANYGTLHSYNDRIPSYYQNSGEYSRGYLDQEALDYCYETKYDSKGKTTNTYAKSNERKWAGRLASFLYNTDGGSVNRLCSERQQRDASSSRKSCGDSTLSVSNQRDGCKEVSYSVNTYMLGQAGFSTSSSSTSWLRSMGSIKGCVGKLKGRLLPLRPFRPLRPLCTVCPLCLLCPPRMRNLLCGRVELPDVCVCVLKVDHRMATRPGVVQLSDHISASPFPRAPIVLLFAPMCPVPVPSSWPILLPTSPPPVLRPPPGMIFLYEHKPDTNRAEQQEVGTAAPPPTWRRSLAQSSPSYSASWSSAGST